MLVYEALKALLRLKEYRELIREEKIKTYIDFDTYKHLKETDAYEQSLCKMVRSSKII